MVQVRNSLPLWRKRKKYFGFGLSKNPLGLMHLIRAEWKMAELPYENVLCDFLILEF